jgi:hypothetical protein
MDRTRPRIVLMVAAVVAVLIVLSGSGRGRDWLLIGLALAVETVIVASLLAGMSDHEVGLGRRARAIRWASLLALVGTVLIIGSCSATGVSTAVGPGYALALAAPASYATTILLLVGPLLVLLTLPALLTLRLNADVEKARARLRMVVIVSWLTVAAALGTSYAGFITSYSIYCTRNPTQATADQRADCVASSGAIAGFFGILGAILVLPQATAALRTMPQRPRAPS